MMKKPVFCIRHLFGVLVLALFCQFLVGCQMIPLATLSGPQIPIYPQNQSVTVLDPIAVHIVKCYWTDEYEKPGLKNVPERYREERRQFFTVKPKVKFLVLELEAVNTGTRAVGWSMMQPPLFQLENATGAIYVPDTEQVAQNFSSSIMSHGITINPGMTYSGTVIFDVPPGDYSLGFSLATKFVNGGYTSDSVSFKWKLTPMFNN